MRAAAVILLSAMLPAMAQAAEPAKGGIAVSPVTLQKGYFRDETCEENNIQPGAPCYCQADIVVPRVVSDAYPEKGESLTDYFRNRAEEMKCAGKPADKEDRSEQRFSKYEVAFAGQSIISVLTTSYVYYGGAHGRTVLEATIYDMRRNKPVTAEMLFGKENEKKVNAAIGTALLALPKQAVSEDAVKEKDGRFIVKGKCDECHLLLLPDGVKVIFDEYAIGPYSAGNIAVTLPKELITDKDILKELPDKK